uniref:Uncharacterized protein n=1 Tax=viral metagenome TaxID=1070528 RepID=A0A6H2A1E4_9ZZZZ
MLCSSLEVVDVPAGGLELLVNGTKGEVKVPLNTDVIVRVQGADPVDDIVITNISAFPDINLCQGDSDSVGVFECTVRFSENSTVELKAYEDCAAGICLKESNVVRIIAGEGAPGDGGTGTIILVGMGLLAAAFLFGSRRE